MNLEEMRASRNVPQVALASYTIIRGKNPEKLICIFEGLEDLPYYETIFNRIDNNAEFCPIIAKGKDQVLTLRKTLQSNIYKDQKIRFFIDHDFDGLKGHNAGKDIYVTEGYSIENHLADIKILSSLLSSEFKCCAEGDDHAINKITDLFNENLKIFFEIMQPVNQAIFYARKNNIHLKNIEDRISEYLTLTSDGITDNKSDIFKLIGWPENTPKDTSSAKVDFDKIDPHTQWRGKFIFGFFIKFLHHLKNDRTSDTPKLFTKKSGVKFDPNGELIRVLASLSTIPPSLFNFIKELQDNHSPADKTERIA